MTKIEHSPHHWIPVSLALAAALLTLSDAHGQSRGAAKRDLDAVAAANTNMTLGEVKPARDHSLAKDQRSSVKKAKRATKRVVKRSRTGVGEIDT